MRRTGATWVRVQRLVATRRRLVVVVTTVVALLATSVVVVAANAGAGDSLLSRGRPTVASSVEMGSTPATAAVDGGAGTRWSSAFADPQWIQIDLGGLASLTRVVLRWEAAYGKAYAIEVSTDARMWTTAHRATDGDGGVDDIALTATGRYVRMYGTSRATQYGYSLWEFEVYGTLTSNTGCDLGTNAALRRPATSSSVQAGVYVAANAVDGDVSSRWSSDFSDPQWLSVDLGVIRTVCRVGLSWETAYGKAYQIQVSPDGQVWTSIYSTTSGEGGVESLDVTGAGRYVRVYGTSRGSPWGYSLWELVVNAAAPQPSASPSATATATASPTASPTPAPPSAPPQPGGDVLLSFGKPTVTSSSQEDANCHGCTADKAVERTRRAAGRPAHRRAGSTPAGSMSISAPPRRRSTGHPAVGPGASRSAYQIQVSSDATTGRASTTPRPGADSRKSDSQRHRTVRAHVRHGAQPRRTATRCGSSRCTAPAATPWRRRPDRPTRPSRPPGWSWSDEFNGAAGSKPDPAKWTIDPGTGQNSEHPVLHEQQQRGDGRQRLAHHRGPTGERGRA